jgi:V-type H+-transporting ATPase subunit H
VRHYSRGKHVLEQLGGKTLVMTLLSHEDPNVRSVIMLYTVQYVRYNIKANCR